jgi:hypothetical protein
MTCLANRTSSRHDKARAHNTFNRATAFHTMSAQVAQVAQLFFYAPVLALRFLVKHIGTVICTIDHIVALPHRQAIYVIVPLHISPHNRTM